MQILQKFDPADPGENEVFGFNFVKDLPLGDAIESTVWSISVHEGIDPAASSRLVGLAQTYGTISAQRIAGLVEGVTYRVLATVHTSQGNTLSLWTFITCNIMS